jgi:iron(III) transport system substrate-binding protein
MLKKTIGKALLGVSILGSSLLASSEVNVYSHRHYDTDKKLFKMFEDKTGIKVNVVKAKASALIKRIESEGKNSPADVLITVDAGRLFQAKQKGILQAVNSDTLNKNIPTNLRDKDNQWYGLTKRARITLLSPEEANKFDVKTYEDLADPKNKGKIVIRSSNNIYNQSLLAAVIEHHGEEYALKWAKGVVANMARKPKGNDRAQVVGVANGIGSVAVANTYYIGKMIHNKKKAQREAIKKVKVYFPTFKNGGTHVNISGAGVAKYAPNKANAVKFIEFLSSSDAQELFAKGNYEYPVLEGIKSSDLVSSWGTLRADDISMNALGRNNKAAIKIFDKAGWK